ncbi:MAG: glycoside hydrolase TIM-barrel-like domain-containing protein [candidate division WOR-3 bacterium]|jgi:hypothetical protein
MSSNWKNTLEKCYATSSRFYAKTIGLKYTKIILLMHILFISFCNNPRYGLIIEYRKGMSVPSWQSNEYLDGRITESLLVLSDAGADHIAVIPTWYQVSKTSNQIYSTNVTPIDSAVQHIITLAKAMGYGVMLKPHLDVEDGTFRAEISPNDITTWFSSYKDFILHYARIARQTDADLFCVGTELKSLSARNEWIEIIDSVRKIYDKPILYAANWDEYPHVSFWEYLDFAGIDAYFPLADNREATIEEYLENFDLWLYQIDNFQKNIEKNVIITEVGFRSVKGSGVTPYDWQYHGVMDEVSQAHAYQTILELLQRKQWLAGIFFWHWDPILRQDSLGYTPYNKLAEEVLRQYWVDQ